MFAAAGEEDVARYETWLGYARPYQIDARLIAGADLDRLVPGASGRWKAALHCATDGRAEPQKAATALDRYGHVDEIAAMVAFVAGPESSYITGANLTVDGGMNA